MKKAVQDIYTTDRKTPASLAALSESDQTRLLTKPYIDALRRRQRTTALLATVFLLIVGGLVAVIVHQYILLSTGRPVKATPAAVRKTKSISPLDLSGDMEAQILTDQLLDLVEKEIPAATNVTFDIDWVKQAALYLVKADNAAKNDRLDDAVEAYTKALLIFPELRGVQRQIGLIHLKRKDYSAAAAAFEKASAEDKLTYGLANNIGVSYLALEDFAQAEANFRLAADLNPSYPLAYFNLATLYVRKGEPQKAAEHFRKYLALKPEDMNATQMYAMLLVDLKQWDDAIGLLQRISRSSPDVAPVHFRLAQAFSNAGKKTEAIDALRRAASLVDPRNALGWMSRPEFDGLRNEEEFRTLLTELSATE